MIAGGALPFDNVAKVVLQLMSIGMVFASSPSDVLRTLYCEANVAWHILTNSSVSGYGLSVI